MNVNKPIVTGLLSYGMSGEVFHGPLLNAHAGFDLNVVAERSKNKAALRYPQIRSVKSPAEVWQDPTIELVVVNTPNETHFEYASNCLEAGKHVVVEKPFTVSVAEADKLIGLAKERNRVLTVFQNRRWDGDFLTLQKVLGENLLGRIAEFEAHYDRYRNLVEANTWKEERGKGTGILYNLGSHMLDQVVVLFGLPSFLDARIGIQRTGGKVDDFYDIRMQYEGFLTIIKSSYLVREPGPRYLVHGHNGSFIKFGIDPQEQALKENKNPNSNGWGVESIQWWGRLNSRIDDYPVLDMIETIPGNYLAFYQNVYLAIREGKELAVKPEQAREVIRLIELCYESNRLKQAMKVK